MASRKINWRMADAIGAAIAGKAFEHLIKPKQDALAAIGREAFARMTARVDVPVLQEFNIVGADGPLQFDIRCQADQSNDNSVRVFVEGFTITGWNVPCVVDDDLWARARGVADELKALRSKSCAFSNELRQQLEGKTTTAAMKAWPEAAEIIANVTGASLNNGFTVPLESLLSKYLPMLAAPQGV